MQRLTVLGEANHDEWAAANLRGERPSRRPYGLEHLEAVGFELDPVSTPATRRGQRSWDRVEHRFGAPVALPLAAVPSVGRSVGVLAILEQFARTPSVLRRLHIPPYSRRPVVAMTCWLAERARQATADERQALAKQYAGVDLFVYWSSNQTEIYRDLLGISADRLFAVPYGTDPTWYTPTQSDSPPLEVVAVGQDHGRDFATLADAARGADFTVHLYCRDANIRDFELPANVIRHDPVDNVTYRDLLRRASLVVIPTLELAYPTGQSVALDAMATAKCCVVTRTPAMSQYFEHDRETLFVPPRDADALRAAIVRALGDDELRESVGRRARAAVERTYNARDMWAAVGDRIRPLF